MQTAEEAMQLDQQIKSVVDNMSSASLLEGTGLEEQLDMEALNFQKGQSSIQQTLDEIQSLRLIDEELAKEKHRKNLEKEDQELNADRIERETLARAKGNPGLKEDQIATMVEAQIRDQMDKIEDKQTQNEAYEVLLYGQEVDQKQESPEELEKLAVESLMTEDQKLEEEEKRRLEARQALQEAVST